MWASPGNLLDTHIPPSPHLCPQAHESGTLGWSQAICVSANPPDKSYAPYGLKTKGLDDPEGLEGLPALTACVCLEVLLDDIDLMLDSQRDG